MKFDPRLDRVVRKIGRCTVFDSLERNRFKSLAESILYQQLAGRAAQTIVRRFVAIYGRFPKPEQVLKTADAKLSAVGISRQKLSYLKDLSSKVMDGTVALAGLARKSDDEVVACVTQVKGIGLWTAEMFLMFSLGRRDVFPAGDYGIQQAMKRLYRVRTPAGMERVAERWRPNRTAASWYLWRSLEMEKG